jgi:hypothetical protein
MEALNLNRIPVGSNPVVHVSQYDVGRVFRFNLFDGSNVYTLDGTETVECNVRKLDGNVVTVGVTNTSSDYIEVVTTEQMTAIHGQNYGEIVFKKGGNVIGSVNFILQVEQSPLEGGITSDSAIYNLEVQVANYVAVEVANQYDSANVIFDNTPVQGHGNGYTVTSEGIGTALDTKQDNITTKTASGSLIHITDGADNIPVKSLVSQIVAVESGSGEKSPDNPYIISGFDNGVVPVCGINLFDKTTATIGGWLNGNGGVNIGSNRAYSDYIPIKLNQPYYFEHVIGANALTTCIVYDNNKTLIGVSSVIGSTNTSGTLTFTSGAYIRVNTMTDNLDEMQISFGSTAPSDYHAYNGNTYTFPFGQTVYGGHFDNKGNLVVTEQIVSFNDLALSYQSANHRLYTSDLASVIKKPESTTTILEGLDCEILQTTYANDSTANKISCAPSGNLFINVDMQPNDFKSAYGSYKFIYPLETPIVLAITSQDIPTLSGENNIFSNCGNLDIEYFSNTVDGLVTLINDFTVKDATELPISDSDPTDTKSYIDTGLGGKADTSTTYTKTEVNNLLADKQNKNVLNIVKHYDSGTSSDALTDLITTYGAVNMVFAFDLPLGYFTGCLTFANDNIGSGFIVLSTTGRFWVVSYVSGTITLTELT